MVYIISTSEIVAGSSAYAAIKGNLFQYQSDNLNESIPKSNQ